MKPDILINRWELIEDQIRALEYLLLSGECDQVDTEFAGRFASVRQQLSTIRVQYVEEKSRRALQCVPTDEQPEYDFGAPRFPYDEF